MPGEGPEERFQSAHDLALSLEAVLQAPAGSASLQDVEERSPYPGLSSFKEKDAALFFGRESEIRALWERLGNRRLLAVIGPSGAGKSSFLRAGVIPARPEGWGAVCATPGPNPAFGLARALMPEMAGDPEAIAEMLGGVADLVQKGDGDRVVRAARSWRVRYAEALLVLDQFEELFTQIRPDTQDRFAALLGRSAAEGDIHVVLSLRDDFLMRCHAQPALGPVFTELTPLGPLEGGPAPRARRARQEARDIASRTRRWWKRWRPRSRERAAPCPCWPSPSPSSGRPATGSGSCSPGPPMRRSAASRAPWHSMPRRPSSASGPSAGPSSAKCSATSSRPNARGRVERDELLSVWPDRLRPSWCCASWSTRAC